MKKSGILILISLFFLPISYAQELKYECYESPRKQSKQLEKIFKNKSCTGYGDSQIRGKVYSKEGEPIVGATIQIKSQAIGAVTDFDGFFQLNNIPEGAHDITVQSMGYPECTMSEVQFEKGCNIMINPWILPEEIEIRLEKPVMYLYPEKEQDIFIELDFDGRIIYSYPTYNSGWEVTASPDGTIKDKHGREYYSLFWEGVPTTAPDFSDGFVVSGEESISFLEEKLAELGLTEKEANEFIIYWYPKLSENNFNLIHFSIDEYKKSAKLVIEPKAQTEIRFSMLVKPLQEAIEYPLQVLPKAPKRDGFVIVEWGGSILDDYQP